MYITDKTNDDIKRLIGNEFTLSSKLWINITNVIKYINEPIISKYDAKLIWPIEFNILLKKDFRDWKKIAIIKRLNKIFPP